jgi:hypothetical protein
MMADAPPPSEPTRSVAIVGAVALDGLIVPPLS